LSLAPEEFQSEGWKAADLIQKSLFWARYDTLLLFLPMAAEIDTVPLFRAALAQGKTVFVPKVEGGAGSKTIRFYRAVSADGPWQSGPFGIREPPALAPLAAQDFPSLVITPGLAFDRQGNRLGRGGGFYDRFFAGLKAQGMEYAALGMCMECQLADKIPVETWDRKMDGVITGKSAAPDPEGQKFLHCTSKT
jgi:5-formyltetrahydrofolate cyclo-ligase